MFYSLDQTWLAGEASFRGDGTAQPAAPIPITATASSGLQNALMDDVGASKRVTCDGSWSDRRDATDDSVVAHVVNGTGPSTGYYTSRPSWSLISTTAGSPCTFGTNDLPDAFETRYFGVADTVTAFADHDDDGYFTVEEWLNGTNPVAAAPGGTTTYGDGRSVYLIVTDDSIWRIFYDTAGVKQDSMAVRGPHEDSIDAGAAFRSVMVTDRDSALVFTYDTLSHGSLRDSASVDSILTVWGITTPPYPWAVTVPGQP
jgi:hypothetical protein